MSGLYQCFLTTALLVAIALFSTFTFYPQNMLDTSVHEQHIVDRTYTFFFY